MDVSLPRLSVVHLRRRRSVVALLAGVAILLELAAGTGLAYVAGWSQVRAVLGDFEGIWLIALVGALLISFVGYHYAYLGIFRVEGGPVLPHRQMRAVAGSRPSARTHSSRPGASSASSAAAPDTPGSSPGPSA